MAATATKLLALGDIRDAAALALASGSDDDPVVLVDRVDSLTPPALLLDWADPWLEPGTGSGTPTMGPCLWTAALVVICVGGRIEPGPGVRICEQLVAYTVDRLQADQSYSWPIDTVAAPRQHDISGVTYLAAFVQYAVPTAL